MIDRRSLLRFLIGSVTAAPLAAKAQQAAKVRRIGFLWDSPDVWSHALEGFRQGMRELGWIEGRNLAIEYRWARGNFDRLPAFSEELVRLKVEVIVAPTSIYTGAAKRATSTIPIVFMSHADPIGSGHVASLAHPGGNVTGLTIMMSETNAKALEILKETVPHMSRVAAIWDPATPSHVPGMDAVQSAARTLGLRIHSVPVRNLAELEARFEAISNERADAVLVLSTPLFIGAAGQLATLALKHKLPSMFAAREHAEAGGLISYGPDRADLYRRATIYIDKILRGAKPSDLPVQQATKFELLINLQTAKRLELTIPPAMLLRANEVIQ